MTEPLAPVPSATAVDRTRFAAVDKNAAAILLAADDQLRQQLAAGQKASDAGQELAFLVWFKNFRDYEQQRPDIHSQAAKVLLDTDHTSDAFIRWNSDFSDADIAVLEYSNDGASDASKDLLDAHVKKALSALDSADAHARDVAAGK